MLNIMNKIGKRKLDKKSIIWASSLGGGAGVAGAVGDGDGTGGIIDCCDTPDMDTAESTCNELLLNGVFLIELFKLLLVLFWFVCDIFQIILEGTRAFLHWVFY